MSRLSADALSARCHQCPRQPSAPPLPLVQVVPRRLAFPPGRALPVRLDEPLVILPGIDADGRLADDADLDAPPQGEGAELFQFFQLFQWFGRQSCQSIQEMPAICVQSEVLQEARRRAGEVGLAIADIRNGTAAEVRTAHACG